MDAVLEFMVWFGLGLAASAFVAWLLLEWLEGDDENNRR